MKHEAILTPYPWRFCEEIFLIPKNLTPFFRYLCLFLLPGSYLIFDLCVSSFAFYPYLHHFSFLWRCPLYASPRKFYYLSFELDFFRLSHFTQAKYSLACLSIFTWNTILIHCSKFLSLVSRQQYNMNNIHPNLQVSDKWIFCSASKKKEARDGISWCAGVNIYTSLINQVTSCGSSWVWILKTHVFN